MDVADRSVRRRWVARSCAWLIGQAADHERFVTMNQRATSTASFGALVSVTQLLAALTYGWPLLGVMATAFAVIATVHQLSRTDNAGGHAGLGRGCPELASAVTLVCLLGTNTAAAALSGGLSSALLPLVLLSLLTQGVYFRAAVTTACALLTALAVAALGALQLFVPALTAAPQAPGYLHVLALVTVVACSAAAVSHLAHSDADARGQAAVDALTGTFNRRALVRHFDDVRARMLHAARQASGAAHQARIGVVAVDIDHFKAINDRFGHERGDAVLVALSQRLSGVLRTGDLLYRTGGEEFLILAPGADAQACWAIAERLCAQVRTEPVAGLVVTISAGVHCSPAEDAELSTLLRCADHGLYRAKREGRDRVALSGS